ncbi:MAG: carboxymuconolactone decarboxylase family protein [Actinobacteria bacterium]|nr:carboxymuconolactone decarboxylase family protein [Actinomycetota bacterium]MBI3686954.1 carboxymuconolactone decarboxylase family protein [Actinomycetota bacterium]
MTGMLIRPALRRSQAQIRHVVPVRPSAARGLVARVYADVEREFGMLAPPVSLHSPAPEPLAACWSMLRESLVASGLVDRTAKEVVAASVSLGNACPYCVEVHSTTLRGLTRGRTAAAIAGDRIGSIADPALRELAAWGRASGRLDDVTRQERPFPAEQDAELVGVAVTFHYLNRMVEVFLGDSPIPPGLPTVARRGAVGLLGRLMGRTARTIRTPGASLDLLPAAPLPADLSWAAGVPSIAGAFARAAAALDLAAVRSVPESVRDLVLAELAGWHGQPAGISRGWVDGMVSGLPATERPAGRLALLTALAPYRVDGSVIEEFRSGRRGDETLIELTAWSSMVAARRVGSWLVGAPLPARPDRRGVDASRPPWR